MPVPATRVSAPLLAVTPTSKNVQTMTDTLAYKIQQQAPNIVINLNDSPFTSSQIIQQLQTSPFKMSQSHNFATDS
jgi:filamentous hemagglutinin